MTFLLKGALVEYGPDFLGPIPNVVIFQFNPEQLTRTVQIPRRSTGATGRETDQAGEVPIESISLTAYFSAADQLNDDNVLARAFGIGPRLAALEKMVYPQAGSIIGAVVDAIGSALGVGGGSQQPVPRESYPRLLFIWGLTRVLPVIITSMTITEQEYDFILNPVRAQVALGLSVLAKESLQDDKLARGAWEYSQLAKDVQSAANLANTVGQIVELIPF